MATKKIVPANPDTKTTAKTDETTTSRKTATCKVHPRKTGRKTSGIHRGG